MQQNKIRGPLVSLAAVAALAGGLWVADVSAHHAATPPVSPVAEVAPAPVPAPVRAPVAAPSTPALASFPAKANFVGKIPTRSVAITLEITIAGDKAVAYACDGDSVEAWMRGSARAGVLRLTSKDGLSRVSGHLNGATMVGRLGIGGKALKYTADAVDKPAGLYVYDAAGVRSSWIVEKDGKVTGVQRHADGSTSPAPELSDDGVAVIDGRTVSATPVEDGDDVA